MAARQIMPGQGTTFTANAVLLLLAACFTAPVIAAPSTDIGCDDVADDASLEIAARDFKAQVVNHDIESQGAEQSEPDNDSGLLTPANYLSPEAAATVREAFQDVAPPLAEAVPAGDENGDDVEDSPEMKSRLHGVTDSELARYRQQMYRVDI